MKNLSKSNYANLVVCFLYVLLKVVLSFRLARIRVGKTGFRFWRVLFLAAYFFRRKAVGQRFLPGGKKMVFEDRKQILLVESYSVV